MFLGLLTGEISDKQLSGFLFKKILITKRMAWSLVYWPVIGMFKTVMRGYTLIVVQNCFSKQIGLDLVVIDMSASHDSYWK